MQDTNLKISPYFDDFDRSKNYQKVLFKPGYSVQTRELNTIQSILQNQIERFGQHVFKDGSVVIPGNVGFSNQYDAVLIQNLINGISVETYRENLVGSILTGSVSGITAEVIQTISQTESERDTITLYVKYISSGFVEEGVQLTKFKNNEVLTDELGNAVAVTTVQNATSYVGSVAYIGAGVYFIRGFFIDVQEQRIILDQYSNTPSYKIGLLINEGIISSEDDETLFDNALGSTNYSAPGADRLKITATLSKQNLLLTEDSNFIELLRLVDGNAVKLVENSIYNELERNLARRTFDESGNYTIKPYTVKVRESLNNGENDGVYLVNQKTQEGFTILDRNPTVNDDNSINGNDYYALEISEGKSYVKGFEIDNKQKQYAVVRKPRRFSNANNQGLFLTIGSYVKLDNSQSLFGKFNFGDKIILTDADDVIIGEAAALALTFGYYLYLSNLSVYTKLTISGTHSLQIGDQVTGNNSGASAFVESVNGSIVTIRQIAGSFLVNEPISSSRVNYTLVPTISSIEEYKLENVRKVQKISGLSAEFSAFIDLDEVIITGSSFTVTGGTTLTGLNTRFLSDLTAKSKLQIGSDVVEVSSVSSSSVTLSSSVTNATYYNVSKLVCKLYSSNSGLTVRASSYPLRETSDYTYDVAKTETFAVSSGTTTITKQPNEFIDGSSLIVTSDAGLLTPTINQTSSNVIQLGGLGSVSSVNVFYKFRVSNGVPKTKTPNTFSKLIVDLQKNSTNTKYGTRLSDRELSLKYPDVYKIHAIRESYNTNDSNSDLFDSITVNDATNINLGDILVSGDIRAKVIEKVSGSDELKVVYLSTGKLQNGTNLAISLNVINNSTSIGIYAKDVSYGRYKDITDDYTLVKNDTADFYRVSKLVRKLNRPSPKNKIIVVFDYFSHEDTSNDFYSVDSYDVTEIDYKDIPLSYDGNAYTDIIDFRYYVTPSTSGSGTLSSPHRETVSSLDYKNNVIPNISSVDFVYPREVFSLDYDFYLGRVDKVYLNETGAVNVITGSDSLNPKPPIDSSTGLLLTVVTLPPYLKKINEVTITIEKNKGYTMRDIGSLEQRLENVEKYTSLNLLEVNTNNLNILDADGRNRFKNGFIVDKFNTLSVADLNNTDYSASIDTDEYLLRPYPYVNNVSLTYNSSSTAQKTGDIITIPYEEVEYINQPYASRVENLQPFEVFNWNGSLTLTPSKDVWYDIVRTPGESQVLDLEGPIRFLFDRSGAPGDEWGQWATTGSSRGNRGTNIDQTRTGVNTRLDVLTRELNAGDTINQINDIRYVRASVIDLYGDSLRPSTGFGLIINNVNSNQFFYPKIITGLSGVTKKFVVGETVTISPIHSDNLIRPAVVTGIRATVTDPSNYSSSYSGFTEYSVNTQFLAIRDVRALDDSRINPGQLGNSFRIIGQSSGAVAICNNKPFVSTNEVGQLHAFAIIPDERFETGILNFSVIDSLDNITVINSSRSSASSNYFAQGSDLQLTSNIISVRQPEVIITPISETRRLFQPDPPPGRYDPLAQSFMIDTENGIFVTSIDLFFYTKDPVYPVEVTIRTMENGLPTTTILPFAKTTVQSANIKLSNDGSVPTRFTFPSPVYLSDKTDYCFVIFSPSTKYYAWVSRIGEDDVLTNFKIDKQPYIGVLLKSANQLTWESDQFEDVKFVLNRAQFSTNQTFTANLNNTPVPELKLNKDPLSFVANSSIIKVFHPNHGMHSTSNYVKISGVLSDTVNGLLSSTITPTAGSLVVNDLTNQSFSASANGFWTEINNSALSDSNLGYLKIDDEIIAYSGITGDNQFIIQGRGVFGTVASQHTAGSIVQCYNINGINLNEINTTHKINKVISLDEFEIVVQSKANTDSITGGTEVRSSRNLQYETIYPSLDAISLPSTNLNILLNSVSGTSVGNLLQPSFAPLNGESVENNVENDLISPRLVVSETNKTRYLPGTPGSLGLSVDMSTSADNVSPIFDIIGSSVITISNRLNKEVTNTGELDLSSELLPVGGLHSSYITKKVVLENSSTAIKVLFDAIRRQGVDIKVFAKVKGDSNLGSFSDMNYIEIPAVSYPQSDTEFQYRAFEYELNGIQEFKEWSIKIVMIGNDQSNVPKIKNFRTIALAIWYG